MSAMKHRHHATYEAIAYAEHQRHVSTECRLRLALCRCQCMVMLFRCHTVHTHLTLDTSSTGACRTANRSIQHNLLGGKQWPVGRHVTAVSGNLAVASLQSLLSS